MKEEQAIKFLKERGYRIKKYSFNPDNVWEWFKIVSSLVVLGLLFRFVVFKGV